jgi:hypothetical protein
VIFGGARIAVSAALLFLAACSNEPQYAPFASGDCTVPPCNSPPVNRGMGVTKDASPRDAGADTGRDY